MAIHTSTTAETATIWPGLFDRIADIPAPATRPDADLLAICADWRRLDAALAITPTRTSRPWMPHGRLARQSPSG